jgi:para-nitrobenzyl esterase
MNKISVKATCGTLVGWQFDKGAAFLGVPYAETPTGERRFRPPAPLPPSDREILALEPGLSPVQPPPRWTKLPPPPTGEDCLNLNLYTPTPDKARRPVLVHLFGGGFEGGSGSGGFQDGMALALEGDCVVIRLNFRVGALGFLYLGEAWGEPYGAGNVGLLDVVAALEWVRQNVRAFGGDPDNVTLFGISSGAFMISSLFGLPQSRGLFHRAWLQSGSASRILDRRVASAQAAELLEILGVKVGDRAALQQVAPQKIVEAQSRVVSTDVGERNAPGGRTLGVVDDGQTLQEHPLSVLKRGDRREVPVLLGTTRDETRMWFALGLMREGSLEDFQREVVRFAGPEKGPALFEVYRRMLPEATPARLREKFLTDAIYRVPALRTALAQNAVGGRGYIYRFNWETPVMGGSFGACHGLDEGFVWGVTDPEKNELAEDTPQTRRISAEMRAALLRFARTGEPGWPVYTPGQPTTRLFGATGETLAEVDSAFLEAWDGVERN